MKPINLYPVTITTAHQMGETGKQYRFQPWDGDTDRIKGFSEAPDRVLILKNTKIEPFHNKFGDVMFAVPGEQRAWGTERVINNLGHAIDGRYFETRPIEPSESTIDLDDLAHLTEAARLLAEDLYAGVFADMGQTDEEIIATYQGITYDDDESWIIPDEHRDLFAEIVHAKMTAPDTTIIPGIVTS